MLLSFVDQEYILTDKLSKQIKLSDRNTKENKTTVFLLKNF